MKSLLRIIFGVLVGIGIFIGIGFASAFLARHFHAAVSFTKADSIVTRRLYLRGRVLSFEAKMKIQIWTLLKGKFQNWFVTEALLPSLVGLRDEGFYET